MPYNQKQYELAKSAIESGKIPQDKLAIVQTRVSEFENDQARGYQRAPETPEQPTLAEVDSQFGPDFLDKSKSPTAEAIRQTGETLTPDAMQARRQQVDWTKKLTTEPTLKNASKLKVFDDPPDYEPPKPLPGMMGSVLNAVRPVTSYFEPTAKEFRSVALSDDRLRSKLQQELEMDDLTKVPEDQLQDTEAFKAYSDARWQHALAGALRTKTPITRVAFSDKTGEFDPATVERDPKTGAPIPGTGERKLNLSGHASNLMDSTMALGTGILQGGTFGGWDLGLSSGGDVNKRRAQVAELSGDKNIQPVDPEGMIGGLGLRDAGRGSMNRNPGTGIVGEVAGAFSPRGGPAKLVGGLQKGLSMLTKPESLAGRMGAGAAVGAATGVIDENMRAAAKLAADALDADMTAREGVRAVMGGLPGVNMTTAGAGAVLGAGADLVGAGAGALDEGLTGSRLRAPLAHFEESGGKMSALMSPRVSPSAQRYRKLAEKTRTVPQELVVEGVKQPIARQRLTEQEGALRTGQQETSISQAKLEGVELPVRDTIAQIEAMKGDFRSGTPGDIAARKRIDTFIEELASNKGLTAEQLDQRIAAVDSEAGYASSRGEPKPLWDKIGKALRDLRDDLKYREEATVVTQPEDKGLFTADPEVTIADPGPKPLAGIRDELGQVKPVTDYSADKARQARLQRFHSDMNRRVGLPEKLSAEPVQTQFEDKGLFNPQTPEQVVNAAKPKVRLSADEDKAFGNAIRGTSKPENLQARKEFDALTRRMPDPEGKLVARKLQIVRQLDDADQLERAMGRAVEGLNTSGIASAGFFERMGIRLVPTLKSLSGGLPPKPGKPTVSPEATSRFRKFINSEFIPTAPSVNLRGGKPSRLQGAARDESDTSETDFSPEEREFWLKVIDKITQEQKAQKLASK